MPTGLANEQAVTVTRGVEDMKAIVRDATGAEFEVFYWQVDVGREFNIGGEHYHESHPRAIRYVRGLLARLSGDKVAEASALLQFILRRNGHDA
ncbi:hypothetical protein [Luteolibacter soli]|uniref:Uncharacterized protein n=1 Tax=Luteolibacter soli TaxID=3135280 RepID=A0ABU9AYG2_9BACT